MNTVCLALARWVFCVRPSRIHKPPGTRHGAPSDNRRMIEHASKSHVESKVATQSTHASRHPGQQAPRWHVHTSKADGSNVRFNPQAVFTRTCTLEQLSRIMSESPRIVMIGGEGVARLWMMKMLIDPPPLQKFPNWHLTCGCGYGSWVGVAGESVPWL
jgi:hypothetical protein